MNEVNVLVVPDVHGRTFWKDAIDLIKDYDKVIFLGDYFDPYDFENNVKTDPQDLINNLKDIISFARNNYPKVTLLLGNHDAHYISDNEEIISSRYDHRVKNGFLQLLNDNIDLFSKCAVVRDILFTHAGVTKGWLNFNGYLGDVDNVNEVASFIEGSTIEDLAQVGRSRGGYYGYGGPLWADLLEHEFNDLKFKQVIGHTQLSTTGANIHIGKNAQITACDSRALYAIHIDISI